MAYNVKPLPERFWEKVAKGDPDDCWLFLGTKNNKGYGMLQRKVAGVSGKRLAHRISFELNVGPVPADLCVLHQCDNPPCVNPRHLFLGTKKDNVDDMIAKGRKVVGFNSGPDHWMRRNPERIIRGPAHPRFGKPGILRGETMGTAKLTDAKVREIYALRLRGMSCPAIGKRYGVDQSTVWDIVKAHYWTHLLGKNGAPTKEELLAVPYALPYATLTASDIPTIRALLASGQQGKDVAARFGVHKATISDIKMGKTWRNA